MAYCEGSQKAEVILTWGAGDPVRLKSSAPPVSVTTEEGKVRLTWSGKVGTPCWAHPAWGGPIQGTEWVWNAAFASPKNSSSEVINLFDTVSVPAGATLEFQAIADNEIRIFANGEQVLFRAGWGAPTIATWVSPTESVGLRFEGTNAPGWEGNPYNNPAGMSFVVSAAGLCRVTVSDESGKLWEQVAGQCPSVQVVCGDCCPNQQTLLSISSQIQSKLRQLQ